MQNSYRRSENEEELEDGVAENDIGRKSEEMTYERESVKMAKWRQ
jgi:hypothetical protein